MATPIKLEDVKAAVKEVVAMHLPNSADQLTCAQETWANRADGFPKAFNEAIGGFGLDPELVKKLVKQFQAELPEASKERRLREEAARKAAEKAAEDVAKEAEKLRVERLRNEIDNRILELANLERNATTLQGEIGTIVRSARDLARRNTDPTVETALETVTEVEDEAKRLVEKINGTVRDARDDGRKEDLAAVNAAVTTVEGLYNRLQVLRTTEIESARDAVQTVVDEFNDRRTANQAKATVQNVVDKAKGDLAAIDGDGIAKQVEAAVQRYKHDYAAQTGNRPPTDIADPENPDRLAQTARDALRDAQAANDDVVLLSEATSPVLADVQIAAARVAAARKDAQDALNTINRWSDDLKLVNGIEEGQAKQEKKAEEEKAKQVSLTDHYLSKVWARAALVAVLFLLVLIFLPQPYKGPLAIAAIPVAILVIVAWKARFGPLALGIYGGLVALLVGIVIVVPLINNAPDGVTSSSLPGVTQPTPTPTPRPTALMEAVATVPPDKTPKTTATGSSD